MEVDYVAIGKRIKQLRREQYMSQETLAMRIDVSIPHMSNIENGKTKFHVIEYYTSLHFTSKKNCHICDSSFILKKSNLSLSHRKLWQCGLMFQFPI